MLFSEFQKCAKATDRLAAAGHDPLTVAILGIGGEVGSLQTIMKKRLRDGEAYSMHKVKITEELGDILWYLSAIASLEDISLEDVAKDNLEKTASRWLGETDEDEFAFDEAFPREQQLPRIFVATFRDYDGGGQQKTEITVDGQKWGSTLTDNAYTDDGYRFHDVFHMTCVAVLGWSPVFRALTDRKRRDRPEVDQVEDGGRAIAIEEGISALIFNYARRHNFLDGIRTLDWPLLRTCHEMTTGLEVSRRTLNDWEVAIITTYKVWRQVRANRGGTVRFDMTARTAEYLGQSQTE